MPTRRVLMGLQFFPRGGSAHVARNLAAALPDSGWRPRIVSGSVEGADARDFFAGLDVRPVDMTEAREADDPMAAPIPLHPSYEDRPDAPDRLMASLDDDEFAHQVAAWAHALQDAGAADCDVLHLHHLTAMNEAAALVAPGVPIVGHLHGTELLMLEEGADKPHRFERAWRHFEPWWERMRGWAQSCERIVVLSDSQIERAERMLGVDPRNCVRVPNGFDPALFTPRCDDRAGVWSDLTGPLADDEPVLLYVGRFTAVKRVPLLVEAYERARPGFRHRAPLVIVGGFPGECEGEHPQAVIDRLGAEDVHLAGWHSHDALPRFYSAADAIILPSVREQFGQVLVEGMASGLPAIAVDAFGPADIIEHGETGWLVEPDDVAGLANALVQAVNRPHERRRRGANACEDARARYAWPNIAREVAQVYEDVTGLGEARGERLARA